MIELLEKINAKLEENKPIDRDELYQRWKCYLKKVIMKKHIG